MLHFDFVVSVSFYFCVIKSDLGKEEFLWACSSGAWACVSAQRHGRRGWGRRLRDHIFNHRHEANIVNQKWVVSIHSKRQPLVTYFLQQDSTTSPHPKECSQMGINCSNTRARGGGGDISHSNQQFILSCFCAWN